MNTNMINKTNNIKNTPFKHIMSITKTNRIISVIITLLWVGVIFSFSLQPAETSSEISAGVGRWILEHLLPGLMQRFDSMPQAQLDFWHTLLRKAGHFSEFFLLGVLSLFTARQMKFRRREMIGFLFCVFVASMDETIQLFVSGRSGQVSDVMLDSVGALVGIMSALLVKHFVCKRTNVNSF